MSTAHSGRVGAIIVNYNAGTHLIECVRSLHDEGVEQIVVVDNASTDGSLASVAPLGVKIVTSDRNLGYGGAANRGAENVDAELLLVINPDTTVYPGMVEALVAALDRDPSIGIIGPQIEERGGAIYPSARTFPSLSDAVGHAFLGLLAPRNRFTRRYRMLDSDPEVARRADWISGACMLVRRQAFDAIGGFDARYFMYLEDLDLCWRAWRAGWEVAYEPAGRLRHIQGVSTDQTPYRMIAAHHRSVLRWWLQTARGPGWLLVPVIAAGLAVRFVMACAQRVASGWRARLRRGTG